MSITPLATVARFVRTAALGSEILAHRIDTWATIWVATGHDSPDTTPGHDNVTPEGDRDTATPTPRHRATKRRDKKKDKEKDKGPKPGLTRRTRTIIVTLAPVAVLLLAMRPSSLGALLACAGLYLLTIVAWGYSPTAALITMYSAIATMWSTLMAIATLIWLPTAYRAATRDPLAELSEENPESTETDPSHEDHETPGEDRLVALVRHLIGDRYGVHLRDIVEALNQASTGRQFTAPEVRAALAQRGVPTRAKVRAPQGGAEGAPEAITRGVHRADLPPAAEAAEAPSPTPSPAPSPREPEKPVATIATSL